MKKIDIMDALENLTDRLEFCEALLSNAPELNTFGLYSERKNLSSYASHFVSEQLDSIVYSLRELNEHLRELKVKTDE